MIADTSPNCSQVSETAQSSSERTQGGDWQHRFLLLVPRIRRTAKLHFRHVAHELREELVQETIARALLDFVRLVERGKEQQAFASSLARYAIAQVRHGRRVGGRLNVSDVSSNYCQRRKRVALESLNRPDDSSGGWQETLVEDRSAGPAEIAAIRLDCRDWLKSLPQRERRLAERLAAGETTSGAARVFGITAGRISQLRQVLEASWLAFQQETTLA